MRVGLCALQPIVWKLLHGATDRFLEADWEDIHARVVTHLLRGSQGQTQRPCAAMRVPACLYSRGRRLRGAVVVFAQFVRAGASARGKRASLCPCCHTSHSAQTSIATVHTSHNTHASSVYDMYAMCEVCLSRPACRSRVVNSWSTYSPCVITHTNAQCHMAYGTLHHVWTAERLKEAPCRGTLGLRERRATRGAPRYVPPSPVWGPRESARTSARKGQRLP